MADNNTRAQVKEITDRLEAGISDLFTSEKYLSYLTTMARFHRYSTRNTLLIHLQKPDASMVAGYQAWQTKFGRFVQKGEKAIQILAPTPYLLKKEEQKIDPDTQVPVLDSDGIPVVETVEVMIPRFKITSVFDVSQTDGKPLPTLAETLIGDVQQYELFLDALHAVSPLPIAFEDLPAQMDGLCRFGEKIEIRKGMSEIQTISALVHEITHAILHDKSKEIDGTEETKPKDTNTKEVESESVSYAVCQYYGIETGANSFGYLASWGKDRNMRELTDSLDTIRQTASTLIEGIDSKFRDLAKEHGIDIEAISESSEVMLDSPKKEITQENRLYDTLSEMFPDFINKKYNYLRLESEGFEPLSLEWIFGDRISVMHSYTMNGDLMYAPMIEFSVSTELKTLTAVSFEQSMPPLYQFIGENGVWHSVDGNGNDTVARTAQTDIHNFSEQWFANIGTQGFIPVRATMEIDGEDVRVTFDSNGHPFEQSTSTYPTAQNNNVGTELFLSAYSLVEENLENKLSTNHANGDGKNSIATEQSDKQYDLGYGYLGNGITVWNRAEERNGDYVTIAHIETDKTVVFYDEDLPDAVKTSIEAVAKLPETRGLESTPPLEPLKESESAPDVERSYIHLPVPDPLWTVAEMNEYGYTAEDMYPLSVGRALELFDTDHPIYLLYPDNTEALAFDRDEIITFSSNGFCGITKADWEASPIHKELTALATNTEVEKESDLLFGSVSKFGIYQIRSEVDESLNIRFAPIKELEELGFDVNRSNYELVYTAPLTISDTQTNLNKIFRDYNDNHPADYMAQSVSISDVIVLQWRGEVSAHYVDSFGFKELPCFTGNERQIAPIEPEQIPSAPDKWMGETVAALEADVKLGKSIALSDLSTALHNDRRDIQAPLPKQKPSIMAQLNAFRKNALERPELRKTAPNKNSLEV